VSTVPASRHAVSTVPAHAGSRLLASGETAATLPAVEPGEITASWLSDVLGGEVGGVTPERIGDGLVGMNLRLTLVDADPALPASVVVKLPSPDPTNRATSAALRHYEREVRFYLEIAPTVDIRVPNCFHGECDVEANDFVLVLEDMRPAEQGDQIAGCSVDLAAVTVAELARLHGPRWDDPSLHDVEWLSRRRGPEDTAALVGLWQYAHPQFETMFAAHLSDEARGLARRFGDAIAAWAEGRPSGPWSVTHGDFRLDNLLFGTAEGGPPVTAVDWQSPGHGPPIGDVSYFIGAGLLPPDRRAHERALLTRYAEAVAAYGIDLEESWLWEQYRREAFAGLIVPVVASQILESSPRSEAMFAAMATRHLQQAIDLDSYSLI
jgi:hypothetical protein